MLAFFFFFFFVVFFVHSCLALRSSRLWKRELIYILLVHLYVYLACVAFYLPLCVGGWLQLLTVGLFSFNFSLIAIAVY